MPVPVLGAAATCRVELGAVRAWRRAGGGGAEREADFADDGLEAATEWVLLGRGGATGKGGAMRGAAMRTLMGGGGASTLVLL